MKTKKKKRQGRPVRKRIRTVVGKASCTLRREVRDFAALGRRCIQATVELIRFTIF